MAFCGNVFLCEVNNFLDKDDTSVLQKFQKLSNSKYYDGMCKVKVTEEGMFFTNDENVELHIPPREIVMNQLSKRTFSIYTQSIDTKDVSNDTKILKLHFSTDVTKISHLVVRDAWVTVLNNENNFHDSNWVSRDAVEKVLLHLLHKTRAQSKNSKDETHSSIDSCFV